jgi:CubicO group peptidase (beta-lactamase class C family)
MGKLYTATAVMQLVEQGRIGLHDPLNAHLRDLRIVNPLGERDVTVYDLLTHRAGLTGDGASSDYARPLPLAEHIADEARRPTLREEARTKPRWSARVGARYEYSNFGLALLGYLVEVTNPEGLAFCDYVQRHVFDPLGMTSTQFPAFSDIGGIRPDLVERMAAGYAGFGPLFLPTPPIILGDYPAGTSVTSRARPNAEPRSPAVAKPRPRPSMTAGRRGGKTPWPKFRRK